MSRLNALEKMIATTIKSMETVHNGDNSFVDVRQDVAGHFATACAKQKPIYDINGNRRFDRELFLKACGVAY